jgi:hypothetical protein
MYAPCIDTAAHRHLTSPARLGALGSLIVRTVDADNGSLRDIAVAGESTVRIGFGVSEDVEGDR